MKKILVCSPLLLLLVCCHRKKEPDPTGPQQEKKNYFPVAGIVRDDIHYVDSLPLGITRYYTVNGHTDSSYLQAPAFDQLAAAFFCEELEQKNFESSFSETSFIDASSHTAIFTYLPLRATRELERVDVLTGTQPGNNQISSIFVQKSSRHQDTLILQKILWRPRNSFQIVTTKTLPGGSPLVSELKVRWGTE